MWWICVNFSEFEKFTLLPPCPVTPFLYLYDAIYEQSLMNQIYLNSRTLKVGLETRVRSRWSTDLRNVMILSLCFTPTLQISILDFRISANLCSKLFCKTITLSTSGRSFSWFKKKSVFIRVSWKMFSIFSLQKNEGRFQKKIIK